MRNIMAEDIYFILKIVIALYIIIIIAALIIKRKKLKQLQRYWYIEIGMAEDDMLRIMGNGYNRSLLKNNRVKYEWRIKSTSTGYYSNGVSTRTYSGVKKVEIFTKDGYVEEVRPFNV